MSELNWAKFTLAVRNSLVPGEFPDPRLHSILEAKQPLGRKTDAIGKPLPDSVLISERADVANYRRIMAIRHELSSEQGETRDSDYEQYSAKILSFLETIDEERFFSVWIATLCGMYHAVFAPNSGSVTFAKVRC